ncbi:TonB-dependent receptor [Natroniella acetigena]|uniref:TonB-dependent receptor plug domain-containing protein n=1 Tax=Natroniella acetigena TaxID=52004 RepID=UPI00200A2DF7|nr:TonB-dependent receptor [Natroniella acetigena]MCK8826556.1 TonB-dependent receptor [Natroniella acetigena]
MKKSGLILFMVLMLSLLIVPVALAEEVEEEISFEGFTLDEFVVIASRHPELLSETPVSVDVITEEDIEQSNAQNVADVLRDVGGVNITDYGGSAGMKEINIRGSSADDVLVLIDGQRMNDPQSGGIDLGQLSIGQIESIEVLRGPASAIYGADAAAGVVSITTKSGTIEPETSLNTVFGSFGTKNYNLSHRGSTGDLGYNVNATWKESDGHREQNSDLEQQIVFTKFDYRLSDYSDLALSLQYNNSEKGAPGSVYWPDYNARNDDEDKNVNLQWNREKDGVTSNAVVYYNDSQTDYYDDGYYTDPDDDWGTKYYYDEEEEVYYYSEGEKIKEGDPFFSADPNDLEEDERSNTHEINRIGLDFDQVRRFDDHTLTYGLEIRQYEIDSDMEILTVDLERKEIGKESALNYALFAQNDWQVSGSLKLTIGSRYDEHEEYGSEFSPRIGSVYNLNDHLNLYTSAGRAYQAPTVNDLTANPELEPETSKAYETGIRYLGENTRGEFGLFRRDVDDMIKWEPIDHENADPFLDWAPDNLDSAKITGGELILNRHLSDSLSVDFNYTYYEEFVESEDEDIYVEDVFGYVEMDTEELEQSHIVNLGLNYNKKDFNVNITGRFFDSKTEKEHEKHEEYDLDYTETNSYFVTDLRVAHELPRDTEVALEVNNLFDKEYEVRDGYPMPERNYMLNLSKKF